MVERLLTLHDAVLEVLELSLALLLLGLGDLLELEDLLLGLENGLLLGALRLALGLACDSAGLVARRGELGLGVPQAGVALTGEQEVDDGGPYREANDPKNHRFQHCCSSDDAFLCGGYGNRGTTCHGTRHRRCSQCAYVMGETRATANGTYRAKVHQLGDQRENALQ